MSGAITAAVVTVGGGMIAANQSRVAANRAADKAAQASQVDIDQLDAQTRAIAKKNAEDSAALERQLTPEVPQLRTAANRGILSSMGEDPSVTKAKSALEAQIGVPLNTPLLRDAIAKARSDLQLGGKLSIDQQNAATRQGAAQAGSAGGGLGLGRDLAARDLGLTSYQVEQDRLKNASQLGGQELGMATDNSTNLLNTLQALKGVSDSQYSKYLSAAQYGQSIQQPVVGLDPTAIANLKMGNASNASAAYANKANLAGANGNAMLGLAGQIGGGFLAYGRSNSNPGNGIPSSGSVPYAGWQGGGTFMGKPIT